MMRIRLFSFVQFCASLILLRVAVSESRSVGSSGQEQDLLAESDGTQGKARTSIVSSSDESVLLGVSFQYKSEKKKVTYSIDGNPEIPAGSEIKITLFGTFLLGQKLRVTTYSSCNDPKDTSKLVPVDLHTSGQMGTVRLTLPSLEINYEAKAYFCLGPTLVQLKRQGKAPTGEIYPWLCITITRLRVPEYVHWIMIAVLLALSGLFSGLNLGILSLDKMDLKIMINTGTPSERAHAKKIRPIRSHGNLLLCSLLFSNVLVNTILTLLIDNLTDGITAVIVSTLAIVIIGEIIPQAVCCRYGLAVAGYTAGITKLFMIITFPMAFPVSKILDQFLGEEIGAGYTRERLKELVKAVKDEHILENEEVGMISGALDLKQKTVKQIMRKIADVFMLPVDATLDFQTMLKIESQGYSRIPVYDGEVTNVIALLNVKQLIMVDYKDRMPLKQIVDLPYYKENLFCVFENTRLDFMFRRFREGDRGHMAFVDRVNDEGPGNPFYERIGAVTLEDVLEELLQQDIMDESDVGTYSARLEAQFQALKRVESFSASFRSVQSNKK